jgi:hypothetical protein
LKEADEIFNDLIKTLKTRKEQVINHINTVFLDERKKI